MKKLLPLLVLVGLLNACRVSDEPLTSQNEGKLLAKNELDNLIWQEVKQTGGFDWNKQTITTVWSALKQSDNVLSIGYKPASQNADLRQTIHQINVKSPEWSQAREQVLQMVFEEEKKSNSKLQMTDIEAFSEDVLPVLNLRVTSLTTIQRLRESNLVRYAEPMGYEPRISTQDKSSSGCGGYNPDFGLVAGSDFSNIAPNAKASWNHPFHSINQAWGKSTGSGVRIMIIDTGVSPNQDNFDSQFNQGSSAGRSIEKIATLREWRLFGGGPLESPNDVCGHGTAMSGACAAPRGTDGNAAGIAYNANLTVVRAAADVFLDESREVKGVSDAYILAGNRSDIRITSMSLGRITSSSQIADAVRYAYNMGKLIFCAGGTSFGWSSGWFGVIFPATMGEVVAVTGVKDNFSRCSECHDGSAIDFVVVMEKTSNGRKALTTAMFDNQPGTVGGSSVATAQTAGIAALVWSRFPTLTRDQVWNKLIVSASNYPSRSSSLGWGRVNADLATN
jgi:subtilisin family serine protease